MSNGVTIRVMLSNETVLDFPMCNAYKVSDGCLALFSVDRNDLSTYEKALITYAPGHWIYVCEASLKA